MFLAAVMMMAAPCQALDAALPRQLAGWTRSGKTLDTGHSLSLVARAGSVSTTVRVRKPGVFGVAADQNGWIDLYSGEGRAGGKALRMASESKGPRCSSIRKIVRYRLTPGVYRVTVEKLTASRVRLMLIAGDVR